MKPMQALELKNEVDRRYAERRDAQATGVREQIAAISSHPYDDWTVDDYIDPTFFNGMVVGKCSSGKFLNFRSKSAKPRRKESR
jgi:hypothetical protein